MQIFSDETLAHYDLEYNEDLAHVGVPGMKWGQRRSRASSVGTAKSRYASFEKNPTKRQFLTGVGKNFNERQASRKYVGKASLALILASGAAKVAVNTISGLKPFRTGVGSLADMGLTFGSIGITAAAVTEVGDRATGGKNK